MGITAKKLIEQAASKIGVKGRGMPLQTDELMDWLTGMKQMLDSWALEELMIPVVTRETFALSKQQSFTIGPGGDFDTPRPMEILSLEIIDAGGENYAPKRVPLGGWVISYDDVEGRPQRWYYERGYPLATIYFDRIPYDPTIRLISRKPIEVWQITNLDVDANPAFAGQSTPTSSLSAATLLADIEFDHGYENAIIFNLAIHMAPDYDKTPTQIVLALAEKFKRNIKDQNLEIPDAQLDGGLMDGGGYYDIVAGP